ncbi:MAG: acyl carrier protein [Actinomycetales bacterium]|nr:MAG: acyl carrier protein [Actinomycetales bacterium]
MVFCEALDVDSDAIDWDSLAYRGIEEWDSVAHMRLVAEIEDTFDVMLDTDEVIGMSSFAIACDTLQRLGVDFG